MVNLVFSVLTDRACVEEDSVGFRLVVGGLIACHLHDAGYYFGIGHVHLAAVCLYV